MKQTAVITGGSSGLGFAFARQLGLEGFRVILIARDTVRINQAVSELIKAGIDATGFPCSVTDESGLLAIRNQLQSDAITIDLLILNAGILHTGLLTDFHSCQELNAVIHVNLVGTMLCAKLFTPLLRPTSRVLMISSGLGLVGVAGYSTYCVSKSGIIAFAESLRRELLAKHISVHVACPGDIDTPQLHHEMTTSPGWMKREAQGIQSAPVIADRILKQVRKNKFLIITDGQVQLLVICKRMLPRRLFDFIMDRTFPIPPENSGNNS